MMAGAEHDECLEAAIAALYVAFRKYRVGTVIETDGYPITQGPLLGPLKNIAKEDLDRYRLKAISTCGNLDQFKHFLPRLCELYATGDEVHEWWDAELLGAKLFYADWGSWPENEIEAVRGFLHAWWQGGLDQFWNAPIERQVVGDRLCSIGNAEADLLPYLNEWVTNPHLHRIVALARFVNWECDALQRGKLGNAWWGERKAQRLQVVQWLVSEGVRQLLLDVYMKNSGEEGSQEIALASDCLESSERKRKGV